MEQRQREIERNIRKYKRVEEASLSETKKQLASQKVGGMASSSKRTCKNG